MKHTLPLFILVVLLLTQISEADKNHKHQASKQHAAKNNGKHHSLGKHHGKFTEKKDSSRDDVKLVVIRESIGAIGLILCLAGSRIIKVTLFTGGFILMFMFSYLTLPSIVDNETCCGPNGNWIARLGVCAAIAILGGLLTLFVYYAGIFAIGGIFGMICALVALSTPLAEKEFFDSAMGVGLFYGAFIIVGGLLALLLSTVAVAAASSLGGSYAVFWAVDYFAQTNFSGGIEVLIVQIQDHIRDEFGMGTAHGHHPNFFRIYTLYDIVIFSFFVILAIMGFTLQIYLASSDAKLKKIKETGCKENHCRCNHKSSDYLLDYLKSIHSSRDSLASKDPYLKHP
ncbi:uncharacterized protein LOC134823164 [Bolinopsis microptera]|uniref:uncharacterized protein LOC134823164 n=1 Tax=Bolinopsis microptera TaxID=2820187 RepID=UPI00307A9086